MKPAYCISDLHVHDAITDGTLFTPTKEAVFARLCERVRADDGELYVLGDALDLTGGMRPRFGLEQFFDAVYPGGRSVAAIEGHLPDEREPAVGERVAAMRRSFPDLFAALGTLAREGRLRMVPGNHDWELFTPAGRAALDAAIGGGGDQIGVAPWYRVGDRFVLSAHGHELDPSNRCAADFGDPDGWRNTGAAVTAVLYHAVMPSLRKLGVADDIVAQIPAVRPEEEIVLGFEAILPPGVLDGYCVALGQILVDNGYPVRWWWVKKWLVTPERLRRELADDGAVDGALAAAAADMIAGRQDTLAVGARPAVVIMGHTHDLALAHPSYVNLGTWIDGLKKLGGERDLTLPVVRIADDHAALYDVRAWLASATDAPILWRA